MKANQQNHCKQASDCMTFSPANYELDRAKQRDLEAAFRCLTRDLVATGNELIIANAENKQLREANQSLMKEIRRLNAIGSVPEWDCHKRVRAAKIKEITQSPESDKIEGGSWRIHFLDESIGFVVVPHAYVAKHQPEAGGYFVQYQDGYQSYSPAHAFESGYSPVE